MEEYEQCAHIEMTKPHPQWTPSDGVLAEEEALWTNVEDTMQ
jgi:hypothetical protein